MKIPMFFASKGHWGEHGMVRVSFWKYLTLFEHHVTKVRWIKVKTCWNIKENMVRQR